MTTLQSLVGKTVVAIALYDPDTVADSQLILMFNDGTAQCLSFLVNEEPTIYGTAAGASGLRLVQGVEAFLNQPIVGLTNGMATDPNGLTDGYAHLVYKTLTITTATSSLLIGYAQNPTSILSPNICEPVGDNLLTGDFPAAPPQPEFN